jgi:hypothetical protein
VHAKLIIVDDKWLSIGSANFVDISYRKDHSELAVAVWDPDVARKLRVKLFLEHISMDVSDMEDVEALKVPNEITTTAHHQIFFKVARENRTQLDMGNRVSSHAFSLDAKTYGAVQPYHTALQKAILRVSNLVICLYLLGRGMKILLVVALLVFVAWVLGLL